MEPGRGEAVQDDGAVVDPGVVVVRYCSVFAGRSEKCCRLPEGWSPPTMADRAGQHHAVPISIGLVRKQ